MNTVLRVYIPGQGYAKTDTVLGSIRLGPAKLFENIVGHVGIRKQIIVNPIQRTQVPGMANGG